MSLFAVSCHGFGLSFPFGNGQLPFGGGLLPLFQGYPNGTPKQFPTAPKGAVARSWPLGGLATAPIGRRTLGLKANKKKPKCFGLLSKEIVRPTLGLVGFQSFGC
uniref:Uncharacterized protein n=1 Tax=Caulerpa lentillifera TaxID=148947 RepID=A0A2Z2QKR0_9CHLO|nr:hypothetical protein [Caulerpa lentillifera]AST24269.1 hypothetical protein [Caulerpa lentillifera]